MKINPNQLDLLMNDEYEIQPEKKVAKLRKQTEEKPVIRIDRSKIRKAKRDQTTDRK